MSGICGVAYSNPEKPVDRQMLEQMTDVMTHRGPDTNGFWISQGIGLGIRSLSIDSKIGNQPVSNEDGTVTAVCNGRIYNSQELRKHLLGAGHSLKTNSEVEVIVHLYEDHGERCLEYLRGMFGFALWDAPRRRLMLARDRLGIKPLHYSLTPGGLFFGSEFKSILISGKIERDVDASAIKDLFTAGWVLAPKTLFSRIRQLLPAHYLFYQKSSLSLHKYWDLNFPMPEEFESLRHRSSQEWVESFKAVFEESVRIHSQGDVPVGVWLSPGIDSSSLASLICKKADYPVPTFSLAFENPQYDEVGQQKLLQDFPGYNLDHKQIICTKEDFKLLPKALWHCEDPFPPGAAIPRMRLSELASEKLKVVLVGEGADTVLGSSTWLGTYNFLQKIVRLPLPLRRFLAEFPAIKKKSPRASRILKASGVITLSSYLQITNFHHWEFDDRIFSENTKQSLIHQKEEEDLNLPENYDQWDPFLQLQFLDMKFHLSDYVARNLDLTTMAYSLEARVPFLDHKLVEFCLRIPRELKIHRLEEKYIFRRAMDGLLPREIIHRKKRGLAAPYGQWLRDSSPEFATDLLSETQLRKKGYFDPQYVTNLFHQHRRGQANYERPLVSVLGVQLWDDLFLHGFGQHGGRAATAGEALASDT